MGIFFNRPKVKGVDVSDFEKLKKQVKNSMESLREQVRDLNGEVINMKASGGGGVPTLSSLAEDERFVHVLAKVRDLSNDTNALRQRMNNIDREVGKISDKVLGSNSAGDISQLDLNSLRDDIMVQINAQDEKVKKLMELITDMMNSSIKS